MKRLFVSLLISSFSLGMVAQGGQPEEPVEAERLDIAYTQTVKNTRPIPTSNRLDQLNKNQTILNLQVKLDAEEIIHDLGLPEDKAKQLLGMIQLASSEEEIQQIIEVALINHHIAMGESKQDDDKKEDKNKEGETTPVPEEDDTPSSNEDISTGGFQPLTSTTTNLETEEFEGND